MDQSEMVDLIKRRGVRDSRVLDAMAQVPRHLFVAAPQAGSAAYGDFALPIGHEQTISQPYIVAVMTEALMLKTGARVLEIGTGSGYQAAVLAAMGMDVYTVERIHELHQTAQDLLALLGYEVHCKLGDGYQGWTEFAPYDGIVVTAAAPKIPKPLIAQLAEGGHLVIPVGRPYSTQSLWQVTKEASTTHKEDLGGVAFVPFISPTFRVNRSLGSAEL